MSEMDVSAFAGENIELKPGASNYVFAFSPQLTDIYSVNTGNANVKQYEIVPPPTPGVAEMIATVNAEADENRNTLTLLLIGVALYFII